MSGGSWEYLCYKVDDAANRLTEDKCPTRQAFGKHLRLVAKALHDIEWVDSADMGTGDEIKAIMECISVESILSHTCDNAKIFIQQIQHLINLCERK